MEDDIFADAEEDVFADASGLLDKPKPTKVKFELQDSEETTTTNPPSTENSNGNNSVKDAMSAWMASFTTPMTRVATGVAGGGTTIAAPSLPTAAATTANVSITATVGGNRTSVAPFTTPAMAAIERRITPAGELWTNSVKKTCEFIEKLKEEQKLPTMTRLPDGFKVPRGITMRPSGKWQAQMYYNGKSHYIGVFENQEVAALAYEMMRQRLKKNVGRIPDSPYYDIVRKALNGPETINDASSKESSKESVISSSDTVKPTSSSTQKDQVIAAKPVSVPKTKQLVAGKVDKQSKSMKTILAARPPSPPPPPPPQPQPPALSSSSSSKSSNPVVTPIPLDEKSTRKHSKKINMLESTRQKKAIPVGKKPSKAVAKHSIKPLHDSAGHFVPQSSPVSVNATAKKISNNAGQKKLSPLSQSTCTHAESPFTNVLTTREVPVSYRKTISGEFVNGGHWTDDEQERFLEGLRLHGRGRWKRISEVVGTRTTVQVKTHAQTYFDQGGNIPSDRPWAEDEKRRFSDGLKNHGYGQWKMIASVVKTRSPHQIESYARAFYTQQNELPSFSPVPPMKHGRERKPSLKVRETSHVFVDDYNHEYTGDTTDAVDTDTMSIDEYESTDSNNHYEDEDYNDHYQPRDHVDDRIAPSEYPWMSTKIVDDSSPAIINGDEYMTASASNNSQSAEQYNNGSVGPRLGDFSSIFGSFSGRGPFG